SASAIVKSVKDKHCRPPASSGCARSRQVFALRRLALALRPPLRLAGRLLLPVAFGLATAELRAAEQRFQISIGPNEARAALGELARQTNTPLLYVSDDLDVLTVHGGHGRFTPDHALRIVLMDPRIRAD